jgi:hypothetical protein
VFDGLLSVNIHALLVAKRREAYITVFPKLKLQLNRLFQPFEAPVGHLASKQPESEEK